MGGVLPSVTPGWGSGSAVNLKALLDVSCHSGHCGVVECPGRVVPVAVGHGATSFEVELGAVRVISESHSRAGAPDGELARAEELGKRCAALGLSGTVPKCCESGVAGRVAVLSVSVGSGRVARASRGPGRGGLFRVGVPAPPGRGPCARIVGWTAGWWGRRGCWWGQPGGPKGKWHRA